MDLFFSRIPSHTTTHELCDFIRDGIRGWHPWGPSLDIARCDVVRITDLDTGRVEFHGLVTIRDQRMAELVIKKLNGQALKGETIEVREYTHRIPGDRRITEKHLGADDRPEERRRKNLKKERRKEKKEAEKHNLLDWFLPKKD